MSESIFLPPELEQAFASQLLEQIVSPQPAQYRLQTRYGEALHVHCALDALCYSPGFTPAVAERPGRIITLMRSSP